MGLGERATAQKFHFGEFTLDQSSYRLSRGTRSLRLEKLPMELLLLLVERSGELVSRDEIRARLWGEEVFLDVDHSINTAVRKVRAVLRDDPDHPRFLETVVGKGYRFAAPVTSANGDPIAQPQALSPPAPALPPLPSAKPRFPMSLRVLLAGAGLLMVLIAAWMLRRAPATANVVNHSRIASLAVLPLENLSGDPAQQYLADGMTEELIGRLSSIHGLRVISRTSVMRFKNTRLSLPEIARVLHVDALVEGSILREGNQVRVNVQLIRGATDDHLWAKEYQRQYRGILALQEEVAASIAGQIQMTLSPRDRAGLARILDVDPEAHENYLKGRYYFAQRTQTALQKSIDYFQAAIAADPGYALAYSGLADAYALLGFRGGIPSQQALTRAQAAAQKAIALDGTLSQPHASLAFIAETYEWDWATAERQYKQALALNPGNARAHHWYAGFLMYVGRFDEGIAQEQQARDLDPVSLPVNNALAGRLLVAGRYDAALRQVQNTLDLDPHFAPAHQTLGWAYLDRGKPQQAIQEFQRAAELAGSEDKDILVDLGFGYAAAGNRAAARSILDKLKQLHQRGLVPSGSVAILYGALDDYDRAFAWLDKAYAERDPELTYLKVPGRRFDPLRHDPRFQLLVRRMRFPQ